jgi:hypothetical protein
MPALPASNQNLAQRGLDQLCDQAESLIETLSEKDVVLTHGRDVALELLVDGYAHVLALDVDRMRLEREIARLAESGDPRVAGELRRLSASLQEVTSRSTELRRRLDAVRPRVENWG